MLSLLVTAGCGAIAPGQSQSSEPGSRGTVTIGVLPWRGYAANVAVVSRILETRLGYKVVEKTIKAVDMWAAMESGDIDVILELWNHETERKIYIDEKKIVVNLGRVGTRGVTGWYIPYWMTERYPDIRDWRNLNKYAHLFRTPASGDRGEILDSDASYYTYDHSLVANLKLNFSVAYSGSEEETIRRALEASKNRTPLLFYFWQPHWLFRQIRLAKIDLPTYTPGCNDDVKTASCDYRIEDLDKIAGRRFVEKGGRALALIRHFNWSNNDQNEVADYLANSELSHEEAADRWINAHPDVWEPWLRS